MITIILVLDFNHYYYYYIDIIFIVFKLQNMLNVIDYLIVFKRFNYCYKLQYLLERKKVLL